MNGPARDECGINYKHGVLGSGHRANATICRALKLLFHRRLYRYGTALRPCLSGNLSGALAVLASEDPAGAAPSAYALDARAEELQSEAGAAMPAAGLGALAHWLWGREHAEAGNFDDARRSYYRAWRVAQGAGAKPIALGLELSAAYLQDDKPDESRALYDELAPVELAEHPGLPGWAHEALLGAAYR